MVHLPLTLTLPATAADNTNQQHRSPGYTSGDVHTPPPTASPHDHLPSAEDAPADPTALPVPPPRCCSPPHAEAGNRYASPAPVASADARADAQDYPGWHDWHRAIPVAAAQTHFRQDAPVKPLPAPDISDTASSYSPSVSPRSLSSFRAT